MRGIKALRESSASPRGGWRRLADWRIATKVWAGFGIVLALLGLIAAEAKLGFDSADRHFIEYGALARDADLARLVQQTALRANIAVLSYAGGQHDAADAAEREIAASLAALAAATAHATDDDKRARLDGLVEAVTAYRDAVVQMVAATERHEAIRHDRLDPIGPQLEKDAGDLLAILAAAADVRVALQASDLGLAIMTIAFDTQRFFGVRSADLAAAVEHELDDAAERLRVLGADPQVASFRTAVETMGGRLVDYRAAFASAAAAALDVTRLQDGTIRPLGA
jgi:methyl-accepting chemotaxis protein